MSEACLFCGDQERVELFDVFSDHDFVLDTCCEESLHWASLELRDNPDFAKRLFAAAGAPRPRRVVDDGTHLISDFPLRVSPISQKQAKAFVFRHHRHLKAPPAGWRFGAAIWNGPSLLGVAFVGRPSARLLDSAARVEVTRLCLNLDTPDPLRWNAASMLYGWCAREARRCGFRHIHTYLRDDESGVSVRAAGWAFEASTRGGSWDRKSRPRNSQNTCPKTRWGRSL